MTYPAFSCHAIIRKPIIPSSDDKVVQDCYIKQLTSLCNLLGNGNTSI